MKTVAIRARDHRLLDTVLETEEPATWDLEWPGIADGQHARRMLQAAKNVVLRNGSDRLILTNGADQRAMHVELGKRPEPTPATSSSSRAPVIASDSRHTAPF